MIGHYCLALSPAQEDRVLMGKLRPGALRFADGAGCLRGVAEDSTWDVEWGQPGRLRDRFSGRTSWGDHIGYEAMIAVAQRFDDMCARFGAERVGRVIRERILSNRARRVLVQPVMVEEMYV